MWVQATSILSSRNRLCKENVESSSRYSSDDLIFSFEGTSALEVEGCETKWIIVVSTLCSSG